MRIFVSPLDWGLGHAARCVPIIRYLVEKKIDVVIGSEGKHLTFLKEYFPGLEFINFPGYRISYSATIPVSIKVLLQLPLLLSAINREHRLLSKIIKSKNIDAVISDNRYGLWNTAIPSVIITHQINIQAPGANNFLHKTIYNYINRFDECWIPDYEGEENLSGALSHPIPKGLNAKYIGLLSRFESTTPSSAENMKYDLLVILSGPEPQRSKLEELILDELKILPSIKTLIIQGLPGNAPKESGLRNVAILPHLADKEFANAVNSGEIILCRAGYSTLMDLNAIGWKKTIFIPTPGQTEQEYLSKLMEKKSMGITFDQKGFSLKDALEKVKQANPIPPKFDNDSYKGAIDEWLKKIS